MTTKTALACLAGLAAALAAPARANDFPTAERVTWVQECMRNNPGPNFEMVSKCSCALDSLAAEVKHDDYVTMRTMADAVSIGGERGGELRDNPTVQPQIKRYREVTSKALKSCFIQPR